MTTQEIVRFIQKYATYTDEQALAKKIEGHLTYKTCRIVYDSHNTICAVCFWNITQDGQIADITDLIIREDYRNQSIMRMLLQDGLKIWNVKFLRYARDYNTDGHDRGPKKMIKVANFLRRRI